MEAESAVLELRKPIKGPGIAAGDSDLECDRSAPGDRCHSSLPVDPLFVLKPSGRWAALDLRGLWHCRDLFYFLTWRDVAVRYKQTLLGAAWAVIQPLFAMLLFTLVFGRLAGMPSDGIPYPIFAYTGLVPWTFFAGSLASGGNSLIASANLITKVYFPRMIIPAAAVAANLVDFAISATLVVGMMVYYGIALSWNVLMLPILVFYITLLALGVGMWMAALNVRFRDIRYALPFLIQLWMFASPIIYPATIVPGRWRWILKLNPLTGLIGGFRAALLGGPFDWPALLFALFLTSAIAVYAAYDFRRMEKSFADLV
jgi:lipopolysaccharide transport system permease protein